MGTEGAEARYKRVGKVNQTAMAKSKSNFHWPTTNKTIAGSHDGYNWDWYSSNIKTKTNGKMRSEMGYKTKSVETTDRHPTKRDRDQSDNKGCETKAVHHQHG